MKNQTRRSALYPIRAVLLLLVCSLLLTGCGETPTPPDNTPPYTRPSSWEDFEVKEFYSQDFSAEGECTAIQCSSNVLNLENISLSFHFGTGRNDTFEKLSPGYYKRLDIYCTVLDANRQSVSHLVAQLDGADERLPDRQCGEKRHNSTWVSLVIPKELLLLGEEGLMYLKVLGIKQELDQEEQEENLTGCSIRYRIHDDKVYLAESEYEFPYPENE